MTLQLSSTDTHEQQLAKYINAVDGLKRECTFEGVEISYLPPSAVDTLTKLQDITMFIRKSQWRQESAFYMYDTRRLIDSIVHRGKKLFLLTIKLGLSLEFLSELLYEVNDDDLPVERKEYVIMAESHRMSMFKFLQNQALVCAPMLDTESFNQVVPYLSCVPFVGVDAVREPYVYDVSFDPEHLRQRNEEIWRMEDFGSAELASAMSSRFKWGFRCEGRWYLFRKKPDGDVDEYYHVDQGEGESETYEVVDVPDVEDLP